MQLSFLMEGIAETAKLFSQKKSITKSLVYDGKLS